jgi:predicted nucleotidyltransferase
LEISYVEKHTIFECIIGSQAYGISTPESDIDKAGVMIPGKEYFYGLKRFDQFQDYPGEDKTVYNIKKVVGLIAENNPNCLDLLFVPERCVLKMTSYWAKIIENADLFVSKKCKFTFSGYAISQLNRIKTHREYLKNPPKKKPERADFGLGNNSLFETAQLKSLIHIESLYEYIREEDKESFLNQLDSIYGDQIVPLFSKYLKEDRRTIAIEFLQVALQSQLKTLLALGQNHYIKNEYIDQAERELKYINALRNWQRYEEWKKHRNKKRAPLEEKFGFDCKHAAHLIRLLKMGKEILQTGKVNVDRTGIDAEELKAIRNGSMKYEEIEQYANDSDKELDVLYNASTLQKSPQIEKINALCLEIIDGYFQNDMFNM